MKLKGTLICAAAVLAVAASASAQAGRTISKAGQEAVAKAQANQGKFQQPRTMKDAELTQHRTAKGATAIAVPTELWNQLHAQKNAKGQMQIRETDFGASVDSTAQENAHE